MYKLLLVIFFVVTVRAQFEVPDATVEVFTPRGFRVSIPDIPGIKLFAFHGKINEDFDGKEAGTFAKDIIKPKNDSWIFEDKVTKLKEGDIIYYWLYVDYFDGRNKLGYEKFDNAYEVKEFSVRPELPQIDIRQGSSTKNDENVKFFEDFSSDNILSSRWNVEQKFANAPDYEFVMYVNRPETLRISDKKLQITPVFTEDIFYSGFLTDTEGFNFGSNCTGRLNSPECQQKFNGFLLPPIASSQISTRGKFGFKYGKIEVRAKLPQGDWIYPEIFLNPVKEVYGSNYDSGQIRIAFVPGNQELNNILHGGVIFGFQLAGRRYGDRTVEQQEKWSDKFHTYEVNWQPNSIDLSVDGKMYGKIEPPATGFAHIEPSLNIKAANKWKSGSPQAPFDQEMYIVLGVGVGGFNFKETPSKPWRNGERNSVRKFYDAKNEWQKTWSDGKTMEIDYVKVTS